MVFAVYKERKLFSFLLEFDLFDSGPGIGTETLGGSFIWRPSVNKNGRKTLVNTLIPPGVHLWWVNHEIFSHFRVFFFTVQYQGIVGCTPSNVPLWEIPM